MRTRPLLTIAAAITVAAALAGCASEDTAGTSSPPASSAGATATGSTTGSEADIAFAQLMIPHHQQAIEMAALAAANATSPEVKALAVQIEAAQDPEIQTMTQWLTTWGAPTVMATPSDGGMDHGGMDMGGMTEAGMMSAEDMAALANATGADFDTLWLQMMIAHHQGATAMAQQVAETTTNPEVGELADAIITGQTAEIATMQRLLAG
ncbi:MAG: DUF305 domain-containing protein [Candidatus Nanopelagicales bacterium]|jgi:uncharacterized protein (DUF305 family)